MNLASFPGVSRYFGLEGVWLGEYGFGDGSGWFDGFGVHFGVGGCSGVGSC